MDQVGKGTSDHTTQKYKKDCQTLINFDKMFTVAVSFASYVNEKFSNLQSFNAEMHKMGLN